MSNCYRRYSILLAAFIVTACGSAARLARADAERIALERVPGTVVEVEQETQAGRAITEVVVRGTDGHLHGIEIDEETRAILRVEDEGETDADDEDGESDEAGSDVDEHVDEDDESDEHADEDRDVEEGT